MEYIDVFISSAFDAAVRWISVGILPYGIIGVEKLERRGYPKVKKNDDIFSRFDTIPACNGHTNRQTTDIMRKHSPRYAYASRGKNWQERYRSDVLQQSAVPHTRDSEWEGKA